METTQERQNETATPQRGPQEIEIEKLIYGGEGLARLPEGEVLFTPWSAPGDRLRVLPQAGKPLRGEIQEILTPGPERVEARCSVFTQCGGCNWQHITGTAQREWKTRIVQESLQRIGKLNDVSVLPTLGEDATAWAYRNRAQWDVDPKGPKLGYHAAQSREIIEFDHCHIIPDALNEIAHTIRGMLKEKPELAQGLQRIEAIRNAADETLLILDGTHPPAGKTLAERLKNKLPQVVGVSYRNTARRHPEMTTLFGQPFLQESLAGQTYRISAGSFFQTNLRGAEQIVNVLNEAMNPQAQSLLDLYAGVGVFALHFSSRVQRVLAIESAPTAMADARENLKLNQATNVELSRGDARMALMKLKENFDVAIVDPPRGGCTPEVLTWLNAHVQRQILYVSCNPATLARDLKTLTAQGWHVHQVQPVDMFPQTYHIECVAVLGR